MEVRHRNFEGARFQLHRALRMFPNSNGLLRLYYTIEKSLGNFSKMNKYKSETIKWVSFGRKDIQVSEKLSKFLIEFWNKTYFFAQEFCDLNMILYFSLLALKQRANISILLRRHIFITFPHNIDFLKIYFNFCV
jgi:hypothetical protein